VGIRLPSISEGTPTKLLPSIGGRKVVVSNDEFTSGSLPGPAPVSAAEEPAVLGTLTNSSAEIQISE